jgi:hypothetical protein
VKAVNLPPAAVSAVADNESDISDGNVPNTAALRLAASAPSKTAGSKATKSKAVVKVVKKATTAKPKAGGR